ncbi:fungal-specific transcription factor domain-containing protein [Aspergillus unguis]
MLSSAKQMEPIPPPARAIISCTFCRQKKLRCDRLRPCSSCVKRGLDCAYVNPAPPRPRNVPNRSARRLNQRVKELEDLVNVLAKAKASPKSNQANEQKTSDTEEATTRSLGRIQIGETCTTYVSGAHWASLQNSIAEIREHLDQDQSPQTPSDEGPALLLGLCPLAGKDDFLAIIPPKTVADRLVARFFSSMEPGSIIVHRPTFQKEYNCFWTQPQDVSLAWLSMFFGILYLAIRLHQRSEGDPTDGIDDPEQACNDYRLNAAYCLIKDRYTTPSKYTIEALLIYAHCEYFRSVDAQHENWVLFGVIMRLALHMGLHRDGSRYPGISCFEAEMRRRIWVVMTQGDALSSFQSGLPRMLHKGVADTKLPRNLLDEDFDENTTTLPPSRPHTDATPLSWVIAKSAISGVFALITDLVASTEPSSYQSVLELDNQLNNAYAAVPARLKFRSAEQSVTDLPHIIMRRYSLEIIYQKSRCILHREHLHDGRLNQRFARSRQICIDAAMKLLRHQATLDAQVQPGGLLFRSKWFLLSLASHDFILAAMILCLEFHYQLNNGWSTEEDHFSQDEFLSALQTSRHIWGRYKDSSVEAMQAWRSISIMLSKLSATSLQTTIPISERNNSISGSSTGNSVQLFTPDTASFPTWYNPSLAHPMDIESSMSLGLELPRETFGDTTLWDFSTDIDWAQFDATVQNLDIDGTRPSYPGLGQFF